MLTNEPTRPFAWSQDCLSSLVFLMAASRGRYHSFCADTRREGGWKPGIHRAEVGLHRGLCILHAWVLTCQYCSPSESMVATSSEREERCHHGASEEEAPGMVILPSIEIHSSTSVSSQWISERDSVQRDPKADTGCQSTGCWVSVKKEWQAEEKKWRAGYCSPG